MQTLLLTKKDVADSFTMSETIGAVEDAYKAFSIGMMVQPPYIGIPINGGEIDLKAGCSEATGIISMKASSGGFTDNPKNHSLPTGMGSVLVYDAETCALLCIMDGSLITGFRTGAAGAVSVKYLARKDSKVVTIIGAGNQARMQVKALREVMDLKEVHVFSRTEASQAEFKNDIEHEYGIKVICEGTKREAVEKADILITVTRGKGDVVEADWIKPGTHVVAVGTDSPGKQEIDQALFKHAVVICDSIDQCVTNGEIQYALAERIMVCSDIRAEIGDVILGNKKGRLNDNEITVFDTTGMAAQDNHVAALIYNKAVEKGLGQRFAFFEE